MSDMKPVAYRGSVLTFRVPEAWVEEHDDDEGAAFYADQPDSGTLRLNIVTFAGSARQALEEAVAEGAGCVAEHR